jgi:hypothetical protein
MRGGLGDENGVAPPERFPCSERAHPRPPVFGATLFRSTRGASTSRRGELIAAGGGIGGGPAVANSGCTLGCVESGRSRSPGDVGEVSAVRTGQDLAASEIVQECCQCIDSETEAHGVKGR